MRFHKVAFSFQRSAISQDIGPPLPAKSSRIQEVVAIAAGWWTGFPADHSCLR